MATKSIKIFVDGHVFDKEFQGTQTFLQGLYRQLMADYPQLDIYFGVQNKENLKNIFPNLPADKILPYKNRKFGTLRLLIDIPFFLKKYQFDFAHFQYLSPKQVPHCKYIVTLHDTLFISNKQDFNPIYRLSRNFLFGNSIKNAAIKTTVSNYAKQEINKYYQIPNHQLHVIPNGIKASSENILSAKESAIKLIDQKFGIKNFILYVSRIEPRKNHLLILKKYLKLKLYEQDISLVFIGNESIAVPALQAMIKNLTPLQKKSFFWFNQVAPSDLENFYKACRLFVYPSKAEGFGIPPIEAAAFHIPVLCSSATAMQDFDFFCPYVFDPLQEENFEHCLADMINHPPSEAFMANVAKKVAENYSWEQSGNLFYNLLTAQQ